MLAVRGLLRDAERRGDAAPGPARGKRIGDPGPLEVVEASAQLDDRRERSPRLGAGRSRGQLLEVGGVEGDLDTLGRSRQGVKLA